MLFRSINDQSRNQCRHHQNKQIAPVVLWVARRRGINPAELPWTKRGKRAGAASGHGVQNVYKNTASFLAKAVFYVRLTAHYVVSFLFPLVKRRYQWDLAKLSPNEYFSFVTTGVYPLDLPSKPSPPEISKTPYELGAHTLEPEIVSDPLIR